MVQSEIVFAGEHLRAVCFNPRAEQLVVSFDYFEQSRCGGFSALSPMQAALDLGRANLRVQTARNDWFLNAETEALRLALWQFCARFESVRAIGMSMGGFGALLFAHELRLSQALLVSPQRSILPDRVPWDRRWARIGQGLPRAQIHPRAGLAGVTLFDPSNALDRRHAREIGQVFTEIEPVAVPFGGHPAIAPFRDAHLLRALFITLITGHATPARVHRLRRLARGGLLDAPRKIG